jgi:hypothetical protein
MNYPNSGPYPDNGGYTYPPNYNQDSNYNFGGYPYFNPQLINNPMTNMLQEQVAQYSDNLVNKGKTWFSNNVCDTL